MEGAKADKYAHLRDGTVFQKSVRNALMLGATVPDMAEAVDVCAATMVRYLIGKNRPHVAIQGVMMAEFKRLGDEAYDKRMRRLFGDNYEEKFR